MPVTDFQLQMVERRQDELLQEWSSDGVKSGRLNRDVLSPENLVWLKNYCQRKWGPLLSREWLDAAYREMLKQIEAQQDFQIACEHAGVKAFDWLARPSIPYFKVGSRRNLSGYQDWYGKQQAAGKVPHLDEFIQYVLRTQWEPERWEWEISDSELKALILKASGDDVQFTVKSGLPDDPYRSRADAQITGGRLASKFGLERIQAIYEGMLQRNTSRTQRDRSVEIENQAQAKRTEREQNPAEQLIVAKDLLETISQHRNGSHAQSVRDQHELQQIAGKYVAFNSDQDKAASKTFLKTFELTGHLDAGVFECLKEVKAHQDQLARIGIIR